MKMLRELWYRVKWFVFLRLPQKCDACGRRYPRMRVGATAGDLSLCDRCLLAWLGDLSELLLSGEIDPQSQQGQLK
jgi:hypothetical protein